MGRLKVACRGGEGAAAGSRVEQEGQSHSAVWGSPGPLCMAHYSGKATQCSVLSKVKYYPV